MYQRMKNKYPGKWPLITFQLLNYLILFDRTLMLLTFNNGIQPMGQAFKRIEGGKWFHN